MLLKRFLLITGLLLTISETSVANPAYAQSQLLRQTKQDQTRFENFLRLFNQATKKFNDYDYDAAWLNFQKAYEAVAGIKDWKVRSSLMIELATGMTDLGMRFYDKGLYDRSLAVWDLRLKMHPTFPLPHYERGLALRALRKEWDASLAFYEAQYWAAFPAFRMLRDPLNDATSAYIPREEIISSSRQQLTELGKSPRFPIRMILKAPRGPESKFYSVGKNFGGRMIPGVGASLLGPNQKLVDVYLGDSFQTIRAAWGEPERVVKQGDQYLHHYPNLGVIIEAAGDERITGIIALANGYHTQVENRILAIGAPITMVMDIMGRAHGFEREDIQGNSTRETLRYNSYGLTFGINYQDIVEYIYIWTLE